MVFQWLQSELSLFCLGRFKNSLTNITILDVSLYLIKNNANIQQCWKYIHPGIWSYLTDKHPIHC